MTELERLRQELIKLRDLLLENAETAHKLFWGSWKEDFQDGVSFFTGRRDAFEDAAAFLTQLINKD